jgi:hypothetical protein
MYLEPIQFESKRDEKAALISFGIKKQTMEFF